MRSSGIPWRITAFGGGAMVWQMVACALAAAGLVLFFWGLLGAFLLPAAGPGLVLRLPVQGDAPELEQSVRSIVWLVESGFLDAPLEIVDCGLEPEARCRAQRLAESHSCISLIRQAAEITGKDAIGERARDDLRQCGRGGLSE